jgi:DNA-binding transcriptional regulator WhiA
MRTTAEYDQIIKLNNDKLNHCEISRQLNIPRSTIRDFLKSYKNNTLIYQTKRIGTNAILSKIMEPPSAENETLQKEYSYLLGMFLGDGCICKAPKNVYRLRISSDAKYPNLINKIKLCVSTLFPNNKVSLIHILNNGKPSCIDISLYSKDLVLFFPCYRPGKKWKYKLELSNWQSKIVETYPKEFWLGLFHSDGSRYKQTNANRYYYCFAQKSEEITNLFIWCCNLLNIKYGVTKNAITNRIQIYNKDSIAFLDTFAGPKT